MKIQSLIPISVALCCVLFSVAALAEIPWHISASDLAHAKKANYGANRDRWLDASVHARRAKDPTVAALFAWRKAVSRTKHNNFKEITQFITANPGWPSELRLRRKAEQLIGPDVSHKQVIDWFTRRTISKGRVLFHTPLTAIGKQYLAEARMTLSGDVDPNKAQLDGLLRESWIHQNFSLKRERQFLQSHGKRLRERDHVERIERLLWAGKTDAASRMLRFMDADRKKLYNARIKLASHKFGLDAAVNAVPNHLSKDEGLLYDRMQWRKRSGNMKGTIELLLKAPNAPDYPKKWWKVKERYIRKMVREGKYKIAYELARRHGFKKDITGFAEAEWMAGWIAFRHQKKYKVAYRHFYRLYHKVGTPISRGRGAYWAARAAQENGHHTIAKKWYTVASQYSNTYYGQLATEKIGGNALYIPPAPKVTEEDEKRYRENDVLKAVYILYKLEKHALARQFLRDAIRNAQSDGEQYLIASIGKLLDRPDYGLYSAKQSIAQPRSYPGGGALPGI